MIKDILGVLSIVFFTSCGIFQIGPNLNGFTEYTPIKEVQWINAVEEYYNQDIQSIQNLSWFYGSLERVREECSSKKAVACIWTDGTVLMTDRYKESCLVGVHELLHPSMEEIYWDTDGDHTREDWSNVWYICGRI